MQELVAQSAELVSDIRLHGSVLVLLQFDVCEAIRLDRLRALLSASKVEQPALKHPGAVRFQWSSPSAR